MQKLEARRQRHSKWSTDEELALLGESWARSCRREMAMCFEFRGHSARAVESKMRRLKSILSSKIFDLPSNTPDELLGDTIARCKLLGTADGRKNLLADSAGTTWDAASDAEISCDADQSNDMVKIATNSSSACAVPAHAPCPPKGGRCNGGWKTEKG